MNSLFVLLGIEPWKPVLSALILPPVPFLVLVLVGARLILPRRGWGWSLIAVSVLGLWFSACNITADALERAVLHVPASLSRERITALRAARPTDAAIVVLGGGVEPYAPEYGVSNLRFASLERLRYGLWLARQTGLPVAFSGGIGWSLDQATPEAEIAARIAAEDFRLPLRWTETLSRDTRENAARTVAMLQKAGIHHLVLVTHGWHMPRALLLFRHAAEGRDIDIEAAPMGLARRDGRPVFDWLPTVRGFMRVHDALHEIIGRGLGA